MIRGALFGMMMFASLVPAAMSLFPAVLKAALLVRRMFPENGELGFVVVSIPLFHIPLTLAIFSLLIQAAPHALLSVAVFLHCCVSVPLAAFPSTMLNATSEKEFDATLKKRSRMSLAINLSSLICIVAYLFVNPDVANTVVQGVPAASIIIQILFNFLRGMFLTSVFFGDTLLRVVALSGVFNNLVSSKMLAGQQRKNYGDLVEYADMKTMNKEMKVVEALKSVLPTAR